MSDYILLIETPNQVEKIILSSEKTINIEVIPNSKYQLFNTKGELVAEPRLALNGDNLVVSLGEEGIPNLVLQNYAQHYPLDATQLQNIFTTTNAVQEGLLLSNAVLASEVAVNATTLTVATLLGATSTYISLNQFSKKGEASPSSPTTIVNIPESSEIEQPEIIKEALISTTAEDEKADVDKTNTLVDPIANGGTITEEKKENPSEILPTEPLKTHIAISLIPLPIINLVASQQSQSLSGALELESGINLESVKVFVEINGEKLPAQVTQNSWTLEVIGEKLAFAQGQLPLKLIVEAQDKLGNPVNVEQTENYRVDTEIAMPKIILDPIAIDGVIDAVEARAEKIAISGRVTNANESDMITIRIGEARYTANVQQDLSFSVEVDTITLVKHQEITASITTRDEAGNRADTLTKATYTVKSIAKPVIKLGAFAGDDVLTDAEAAGEVTISGTVENGYDGQSVRVRCGCPSCSGNQWVEVDAIIQNGQFTATFNGTEIVRVLGENKQGTITADYTALSPAQQSSQADQASKLFIRRDDQATVEAYFEPYMVDNIINKQEAEEKDFREKGLWLRGILNIPDGITINNISVFSGEREFKMRQNQFRENGVLKRVFVTENRKHIPKSLFEQNLETEFSVRVNFTRPDGSKGVLESAPAGISKPLKIVYDIIDPTMMVQATPLTSTISQTSPEYTTLSGNYTAEDNYAFNQESVAIQLSLPTGKQYRATVDTSAKTWTVDVLTQDLIYQQGETQYDLTITGTDVAGNSASITAQGSYTVDTLGPVMQVASLTIGEQNQVQAVSSAEQITISGKLTGEFKAGESVTLKLKGSETALGQAQLNDQGEFSLEVSRNLLVEAENPTVEVSYATTDNVGNTGSVNDSQRYAIANGDIRITLNPLANDDFINVTEATPTEQNQPINFTVTGQIAGSKAEGVSTVSLNVNGVEKTVNVDQTNKTFSTTYRFDELQGAQEHRITATVYSLDNSANAKTTLTYDIAPYANASIDITEIGTDFSVSAVNTSRISGTVEFDGIYAQGKNAELLRSINLKIGDKTYTAGFNGKQKSFFVDIPNDELVALNGQAIQIDFEVLGENKPPRIAYELTENQNGTHRVHFRKNPTIEIKNFTLTGDSIANENGQFNVNKPKADMTTISGTVGGIAKENDEITIQIGEQIYKTTVQSNRFQLQVKNSDLQHQADQKVKATLSTTDASGKVIQVSDVERYIAMEPVSSEFVSAHSLVTTHHLDHTNANYNFAYFIRGVDFGGSAYAKIPFGGGEEPAVIKYHFADPTNLTGQDRPQAENIINPDSYVSFREEHKDTIRAAYRSMEDFLNLRFEESTEMLERFNGTRIYRAKLTGNGSGSSAIAWPGGDLVWNDFWGGGDGKNTYTSYTALHEISHTLQMNHSERPNREGRWVPQPFFDTEANTEFTLMSYNTDSAIDFRSLRMYDLAFLHYRFGVSKKARIGNDIYSFKDYNFNSADGALYIWDGGGVDTFDASKENQGVNVNLTPGSWIYRGEELSQYFAVKGKTTYNIKSYFGLDESANVQGGFSENGNSKEVTLKNYTEGQAFIGYGTQIENLIGSDHADVLTGNNADNNIFGGDGNDTIKGGAGNDRLDGGKGADQLFGEAGDDIYVVDNEGDVVTELADQGTDLVYSHINYQLTDNVENLTLIGTTANQATGNGLDNVLIANNIGNTLNGGAGNDRLIGGLGSDTLIGGEGQDTFVFNTELNGKIDHIQDFNVAEDRIELSRAIFTNIIKGMPNFDQYIRYDSKNGQLSYDSDGSGKTDAIHFATLQSGLDENQIRYDIV